MKAYLVDADDYAILKSIEKQLYGDGTSLSEHARRDLTNKLNLILGRFIETEVPVMKAFWINAADKTVTAVEYSGLADLQRMIGGYIELFATWERGDVLFGDEEGLIKGRTTWFKVIGHNTPFCGNGVVVGAEIDDGDETADPWITLEQLTSIVTFITDDQARAWARGNASDPAIMFVDVSGGEPITLASIGELFDVAPPTKPKE